MNQLRQSSQVLDFEQLCTHRCKFILRNGKNFAFRKLFVHTLMINSAKIVNTAKIVWRQKNATFETKFSKHLIHENARLGNIRKLPLFLSSINIKQMNRRGFYQARQAMK